MAIQNKTQLHTATAALPAPITRASLITVLDNMIDSWEDIIQEYTTAARNALTPAQGQKIFNTTNFRLEIYSNATGLWLPCSQKTVVAVDCSANPNYVQGGVGDAYIVSVAGKIGGAGGKDVYVGDIVYCIINNAGGNEAGVGTSWQVCHSQGVTDNQTFYAKIALTSAQILALNTTPITVIAAPGAGKVIAPISVIFNSIYNTITYVNNTSVAVKINGVAGNGFAIGGLASYTAIYLGSPPAAQEMLENAALVVMTQTGNTTTGDGTATVGVYYKIHTI